MFLSREAFTLAANRGEEGSAEKEVLQGAGAAFTVRFADCCGGLLESGSRDVDKHFNKALVNSFDGAAGGLTFHPSNLLKLQALYRRSINNDIRTFPILQFTQFNEPPHRYWKKFAAKLESFSPSLHAFSKRDLKVLIHDDNDGFWELGNEIGYIYDPSKKKLIGYKETYRYMSAQEKEYNGWKVKQFRLCAEYPGVPAENQWMLLVILPPKEKHLLRAFPEPEPELQDPDVLFNQNVFNRFREVDAGLIKFPPKRPLPLMEALLSFSKNDPILLYPILRYTEFNRVPNHYHVEFISGPIVTYSTNLHFFTKTTDLVHASITDNNGELDGCWEIGTNTKSVFRGGRLLGMRELYQYRDRHRNLTDWRLHFFKLNSAYGDDVPTGNPWRLVSLFRS